MAILASFMPMLADTGGNAGSQSATLVISALALKEITPRDALKILAKEFKVAFLMAIALAIQIMSSTLTGAFLPLIASSLRLDTAVVASQLLTTVVDITGLFIYFSVAKLILGL